MSDLPIEIWSKICHELYELNCSRKNLKEIRLLCKNAEFAVNFFLFSSEIEKQKYDEMVRQHSRFSKCLTCCTFSMQVAQYRIHEGQNVENFIGIFKELKKITEIKRNCPNLKIISVDFSWPNSRLLNEIVDLVNNCANLEVLSWNRFASFIPSFFRSSKVKYARLLGNNDDATLDFAIMFPALQELKVWFMYTCEGMKKFSNLKFLTAIEINFYKGKSKTLFRQLSTCPLLVKFKILMFDGVFYVPDYLFFDTNKIEHIEMGKFWFDETTPMNFSSLKLPKLKYLVFECRDDYSKWKQTDLLMNLINNSPQLIIFKCFTNSDSFKIKVDQKAPRNPKNGNLLSNTTLPFKETYDEIPGIFGSWIKKI